MTTTTSVVAVDCEDVRAEATEVEIEIIAEDIEIEDDEDAEEGTLLTTGTFVMGTRV